MSYNNSGYGYSQPQQPQQPEPQNPGYPPQQQQQGYGQPPAQQTGYAAPQSAGGYQPQQGYPTPGSQPQQAAPQQSGRVAVDGWSAAMAGIEPGKAIEYEISESEGQFPGSKFYTFTLYKPFKSRKPEDNGAWKKGFNFNFSKGINDIANQIVDRLNHALIRWGNPKGQYVFHPAQQQQMNPNQQQMQYGGQSQQQQQAPQQGQPYTPGPNGYPPSY